MRSGIETRQLFSEDTQQPPESVETETETAEMEGLAAGRTDRTEDPTAETEAGTVTDPVDTEAEALCVDRMACTIPAAVAAAEQVVRHVASAVKQAVVWADTRRHPHSYRIGMVTIIRAAAEEELATQEKHGQLGVAVPESLSLAGAIRNGR